MDAVEQQETEESYLNFWKTALLLACTGVAFGQGGYGGPSVLSRGQAPSNATVANTSIRPYVSVQGIYDSGLMGVSVDPNGHIVTKDAFGVQGDFGANGQHSWRNTILSLDYRGTFRHYSNSSYFDGSDHTLNLTLNRQLSKHLQLTLREAGGTYTRNYGFYGTAGMYDPTALQLPEQDIFDNRVYFANTEAGVTYEMSRRLSFNGAAEGFLVRRRSNALFGVVGATVRGDTAYRYSRYGTVGMDYYFTRFDFHAAYGSSAIHSLGLNWAMRLSRTWEMALRLGAARVESDFLQRVQIDPAVQAIIGQSVGIEAAHRINLLPDVNVRLAKNFHHALLQLKYQRSVSPGNGLFLTSSRDRAEFEYSYQGVRRWTFGINGSYNKLGALIQTIDGMKTYMAGVGATRQIGRNVHLIVRLDERKYQFSGSNYNRNAVRTTLGIAYSPGEVPLALW